MEEKGLTDEFLAEKIRSLLDAETVQYFQRDGVVTDERIVPALETQRKTAELVARLRGHLREQTQGDVNIGMMALVVAAVRGDLGDVDFEE